MSEKITHEIRFVQDTAQEPATFITASDSYARSGSIHNAPLFHLIESLDHSVQRVVHMPLQRSMSEFRFTQNHGGKKLVQLPEKVFELADDAVQTQPPLSTDEISVITKFISLQWRYAEEPGFTYFSDANKGIESTTD